MICMRLENYCGVIISFCYKNVSQVVVELGHCEHLDREHV